MNKRKNKIFLGCLLLLVTLSVGYAAFSENVLVTGTSKSQGTFDITATCYTGVSGVFTNNYADDSNGYNNDTCSVSGNSVSFSVNLEYPTATRKFTVVLKNNGSIPALFKANTVVTSNASIVKYNSSGTATATYNKATDSTNYSTYAGLYGEWYRQATIHTNSSGTSLAYSSSKSFVKNSSGTIYLKLNPNETLSFLIYAKWPNGTVNGEEYIYSSNSDGSYWKSTITYTYPFYQYTRGMTECSNSSCN